MTTTPAQLRRSLTRPWEELARHTRLAIDTGLAVYIRPPESPWQHNRRRSSIDPALSYFPRPSSQMSCAFGRESLCGALIVGGQGGVVPFSSFRR
jgi:hypothetical protein